MKVLILSFSSNKVNEDSYIPNKMGLTFSCVEECEKNLKENDVLQVPLSYEIKVSVRQLVEFVLRSGDIDNRRTSSVESAMQEGSRLHRMIQRRMGEEYEAEVLLRYRYETPDYLIGIEGRADGIITLENKSAKAEALMQNLPALNQYDISEENPLVTIDEIKGTYRDVSRMKEPVPVHVAQAKCYAYIYYICNNTI